MNSYIEARKINGNTYSVRVSSNKQERSAFMSRKKVPKGNASTERLFFVVGDGV